MLLRANAILQGIKAPGTYLEMAEATDRPIDRPTDRPTDRPRDRESDQQTDQQTDRMRAPNGDSFE